MPTGMLSGRVNEKSDNSGVWSILMCTMNSELTERHFTNWVNEYADVLYAYAVKRCPSNEVAKDLVQETYLAAWRNRNGFRHDASPKTWLFTILKSKLIDHYRKTANRLKVSSGFQDVTDDLFFDEAGHWREDAYPRPFLSDLESPVVQKEFNSILDQCCKKLRDIQATVFVMKYLDDEDSESICRQLNITSSNYWVLLHRAKVQLRACLEKNWIN